MSDFLVSLKVTGGALIAPEAVRALIEETMGPAILRAATGLVPTLIAATPRKTGALQRDYHILDPAKWDGSRYATVIYNERAYAATVQEQGRSAGYIDRGLAQGKDAAITAIKAGGPALAARLWVAS